MHITCSLLELDGLFVRDLPLLTLYSNYKRALGHSAVHHLTVAISSSYDPLPNSCKQSAQILFHYILLSWLERDRHVY